MKWLRALACDDEASLCDLMARRVEMLGLQVDTTQGGQAGPALIGSDKYDLVATDTYEVGRGTGFHCAPACAFADVGTVEGVNRGDG